MANLHPTFRSGPALALGLLLALAAADASALYVVNLPWIAPAARGRSTEAYMNLTSTEGATLVGVSTEVAASVAFRKPGRRPEEAGDLMLPRGAVVSLAPDGHRLVLKRLARDLRLGEHVVLTLTFEALDGSRQEVAISAEVRRRSPIDDEGHPHRHTPRPRLDPGAVQPNR